MQDKYLPIKYKDTRHEYTMKIAYSDNYIDYYEVTIEIDVVCLRYFFEIKDTSGEVTYYGNLNKALDGRKNLVNKQSFSGSLGDYESAVLVE